MQVTKKRVLLLLALVALAALMVLPAAASALSGPRIQVIGQPWPSGGYISSTSVDLMFMSSAPTGLYYSLNSKNVSAADSYTTANESAATAYVPGTYVEKDAYALKGTAPADGDVMEIRVSFWKDAAETTLVQTYTVQVTYDTTKPVTQLQLSDGSGGVMGQQGALWFNTPYITATLSTPATLGTFFWNVDGNTGSISGQNPYSTGIDGLLNHGAGDYAYDGLHTISAYARSAANVTGPTAGPITLGVDTKEPTIDFAGLANAWTTGKVTFTITYSDPGGSGIAPESMYFVVSDENGTEVTPNSVTWSSDATNPYIRIATVTVTIPATAAGSWKVDAYCEDMVGNDGSNSTYFGVDNLPPSTKYTADQPASVADPSTMATWTNKPVTLNFTAIDAGPSGVDYTEYLVNPATAPTLSSTGTHGSSVTINTTAPTGAVPVYFRSVDKAGNKESWNEVWVWFDGVAPTLSDNYPAGWWMNDSFYVTITAKDPNSGLAAPGIQWMVPNWAEWNNGNPSYPYAVWSPGSQSPAMVWFDVTNQSDGKYTLNEKVADVAGNVATADTPVQVDTRAPKSDAASGWIKGGAPYVITATDQASGSGVAVTYYRVDNATTWSSTSTGPADPATAAPVTLNTPVTVSGADGSVHTVDFFSIDNSAHSDWDSATGVPFPGNSEAMPTTWGPYENLVNVAGYQTRTVKIDSVAPTTTVQGADADWHKTPVTLFFTGSDSESGVAYTEWSLDGTNWTKGNQAVVSTNGVDTVSYRSVDNVGNVEATKTVTVDIATTPPVCKAYNATVKVGKTATLKYMVTAVTATADVKIQIKNSHGTTVRMYLLGSKGTKATMSYKVKTGLKAGKYHIVVSAVDQAGNIQSVKGVATLTVKK